MSGSRRGSARRPTPAVLTGTAAAVGFLVTLLVSALPMVHVAYRSVPAHVSLETADALIATMVAYLAYGRLRRGVGRRDTLLVAGFALLAFADVAFVLVPSIYPGIGGPFFGWSSLVLRVVAAGFITGAAASPAEGPVRRTPWTLLGLLGAVVVALWVSRGGLPAVVDPTPTAPVDGYPRPTGQPGVLAGQLVQVLMYAAAAAAFTRRARLSGERLDGWLGAAMALAAFSRLNYFLFPTMYSQWVYTGDLLRTGSYLVLVAGAASEVRGYWQAQAEAAVFAERRRVARDLHDGAVQEIGYVRSLAARRAADGDAEAARITAAAERALDEMRAALTALRAPLNEPLAETLRRAAGEVADRHDVPVEVVCDRGGELTVGHEEREALVRIVREAVTNAVRHGGAAKVRVELAGSSPRRLVVRDDGSGFDPGRVGHTGFGLTSMADRAAALGGALHIRSVPGGGTTVELTW